MKKIFLVLLVITSVLSSCKKYEDDGFISLRTAKARLIGSWKAVKAFDKQGKDVSSTFTSMNYQVRFDKDGKFNASAVVLNITINVPGKWEFVENEQSIKITMDSNQFNFGNSIWKIKKLYGGELHVTDDDGEIHFTKEK